MSLRHEIESALRSWNAHEIERGAPPVVDFDCDPPTGPVPAATSRLSVRAQLVELLQRAEGEGGPDHYRARLRASLAYLDSLLGARLELPAYVSVTQGCAADGWPTDYVAAVGRLARENVESLGVAWDSDTV